MPKPLRLPNLAEPHVLDHLQVRLIEPHEKDAWNQLVVAHHYLKNADLVGAQLRYVAQYVKITWGGRSARKRATFDHL